MEMVKQLFTKIAQAAYNSIPVQDDVDFKIEVNAITKFFAVKALYVDGTGKDVSFNPDSSGIDITPLIKELRDEQYQLAPNKGAWYSAILSISKDGKLTSNFDYDNMPKFRYVPDDAKFKDDLEHYPREEKLVPEWLKEIIKRV